MRIYIFIAAIAGLCVAYFTGVAIGRAKCVADVSANSVQVAQQQIKYMEEINVEINHSSVRDIRDILRKKYTIAE